MMARKSETIDKTVAIKERPKPEQWLRLLDFAVSRGPNLEFLPSFAFAQDCSKDVHQLAGFCAEIPALLLQSRFTSAGGQPKSVGRFLRFLSASLDAQQEVLFADRLIRLNVIGANRARGPNELFSIFNVRNRPWEFFHEVSRFLREEKRAVLQVVRSIIRRFWFFLHFTHSNSICFGFRYSNFGFPLYDYTT
jgi:hypothetical protein